MKYLIFSTTWQESNYSHFTNEKNEEAQEVKITQVVDNQRPRLSNYKAHVLSPCALCLSQYDSQVSQNILW